MFGLCFPRVLWPSVGFVGGGEVGEEFCMPRRGLSVLYVAYAVTGHGRNLFVLLGQKTLFFSRQEVSRSFPRLLIKDLKLSIKTQY